jgi:hypothetical protein
MAKIYNWNKERSARNLPTIPQPAPAPTETVTALARLSNEMTEVINRLTVDVRDLRMEMDGLKATYNYLVRQIKRGQRGDA